MSTAQKLQKDMLDNDNLEALKVLEVIKQFHIVVEFEADGRVLTANENFLKVMGYTSEELKGAHHRKFFPNEYVENLTYRIFLDKLNRGESDTGESKMLSKNGREAWFNGSYCPSSSQSEII
jgi:PAS domain S-box-containing protein